MENPEIDIKLQLRSQYRRIRSNIKSEDRSDWNEAISDLLLSLPEVVSSQVVFIYLSRSGEVSTTSLVKSLLGMHKRVLTPSPDIRALPHHGLFRVFSLQDSADPGPPMLCRECRIEDVDVIVVPGIAWDKEGYRVGFGGGYFDRLLSMARPDCLKVGLSFECQILDSVPRESWDEKVDLVITEAGIHRPKL